MKVELTYTIHLNEGEKKALKKLLGNMNDDQFSQFGIKGEDRIALSELWDSLPYSEDE